MMQQRRGSNDLEPGRPFPCGLLVAIIVVVAVFMISVWLAAVLWDTTEDPNANLEIRVEVVKHLLQLSIVIIIGGVVAALFKIGQEIRKENRLRAETLAEQTRQQNRLRAETRADYMKRLGTLYREAKAARRSLRAAGLTTRYKAEPEEVSGAYADAYRKEMERINDAQLELEALKVEAESLPEFALLPQLTDHLGDMEDYLSKIIGEYEEFGPKLDSDDKVRFSQLERLDEFTGEIKRAFVFQRDKKKAYRFKTHFSQPYESAIRLISQQLAYTSREHIA